MNGVVCCVAEGKLYVGSAYVVGLPVLGVLVVYLPLIAASRRGLSSTKLAAPDHARACVLLVCCVREGCSEINASTYGVGILRSSLQAFEQGQVPSSCSSLGPRSLFSKFLLS